MEEPVQIRRQRILVINDDTLLAAGLQSLLSQCPGLDVVALTPRCPAELTAELERFRPDMILLACGGPVTSPPELLGMLGEYPVVRVVAVSCDRNTVYVYDRVPVTVTALSDLLALIPVPGASAREDVAAADLTVVGKATDCETALDLPISLRPDMITGGFRNSARGWDCDGGSASQDLSASLDRRSEPP